MPDTTKIVVLVLMLVTIGVTGKRFVRRIRLVHAELRWQTPVPELSRDWRNVLVIVASLVIFQGVWRVIHLPQMPFACCDDILIPRRTLELSQYPFFSPDNFRASAIGQAFQSRYGALIYLLPYMLNTLLEHAGIPLNNLTLNLMVVFIGLIRLPVYFATAYEFTGRKEVALLAAAVTGFLPDMLLLGAGWRNAYPLPITEALTLLFVLRWMKHGRQTDMLASILSLCLLIGTHNLFPLSLILIGALQVFPPPGVQRRHPWAYFVQAGEQLIFPLILLLIYITQDYLTYQEAGTQGEGLFLQMMRRSNTPLMVDIPRFVENVIQAYALSGTGLFCMATAAVWFHHFRRHTIAAPFLWLWLLIYAGLLLPSLSFYHVYLFSVPFVILLAMGVLGLMEHFRLRPLMRSIFCVVIVAGLFMETARFFPIARQWRIAGCYKAIGYIMREYFPDRKIAASFQIGLPTLYWYNAFDALPPDFNLPAPDKVMVLQDAVTVGPNPLFEQMMAPFRDRLNTVATIIADDGLPVCSILADSAISLGNVTVAEISQQFDAKYHTMHELLR